MTTGEVIQDGAAPDPIAELSALVTTDSGRRVLEIMRRQADPNAETAHFDLDRIEEIDDPGTAAIYLMHISHAVAAYDKRNSLLRDRFNQTKIRGQGIVDSSYQAIESNIHEIDTNHLPTLYGKVYAREEVAEITELARKTRKKADARVYTDAEIPENEHGLFAPHHVFLSAAKMFAILKDGHVHTQHPLVQSTHSVYFATDMTTSPSFNNRLLGLSSYGGDHTVNLVRAEQIAANALQMSLSSFSEWEDAVGEDEVAKLIRAALPMDVAPGRLQQPASSLTAHEGLQSVMQTVALFTSQIHPGYRDPDQLVFDLIDAGLVSRFARKIPYSGIIGPMSLSAIHFASPLSGSGSSLKLAPELEANFAEARRMARDYKMISYEDPENDKGFKHFSLNGCPVGHGEGLEQKGNGVDMYAMLFKAAYEKALTM